MQGEMQRLQLSDGIGILVILEAEERLRLQQCFALSRAPPADTGELGTEVHL